MWRRAMRMPSFARRLPASEVVATLTCESCRSRGRSGGGAQLLSLSRLEAAGRNACWLWAMRYLMTGKRHFSNFSRVPHQLICQPTYKLTTLHIFDHRPPQSMRLQGCRFAIRIEGTDVPRRACTTSCISQRSALISWSFHRRMSPSAYQCL
ncbi:hypothetical protein BC834DRAFT_169084 [Gloeopeniophorella convolvens]|nr:hypothetical protein BC834DRAFT_169084 [Gloeopeniophorella convolvens]